MTTVGRTWSWAHDDNSRTRLRRELAEDGFGLFASTPGADGETAACLGRRSPWQLARDLFGEVPAMVEMQPIEPREGARSFAATRVFTPLHTDSQSHLGIAPNATVMCCVRPAARGLGTPLVADAWALASQIATTDPPLFAQLVTRVRRVPFVFGDVWGPTLALRGSSRPTNEQLVFTHSPMAPRAGDPVAQALAPRIRALPTTALSVLAGDVLVIDNHRMLHGRTAFDASPASVERSFVRLLVWLSEPFGRHDELARRAAAAATTIDAALVEEGAPEWARARFGRASPLRGPGDADVAARRLAIVLEMLRGTPPGRLAARESIPEPELYRWRDAAMTAASSALATLPSADDADHALKTILDSLGQGPSVSLVK